MISNFRKKYSTLIVLLLAVLHTSIASAQIVSDNFIIDAYTVGEHGGVFSTSTNFQTTFGVTNISYGDPVPIINSETGSIIYGSKSSTTSESLETNVPPNTVEVEQSQDLALPQSIDQLDPTGVLVFTPRYRASDYPNSTEDSVILYKTLQDGLEVQITIPPNTFFIPEIYNEQTQGIYRIYIAIGAVLVPTSLLPQKAYGLSLLNNKAYRITIFDSLNNKLDHLLVPLFVNIRIPSTLDYTINLGGYFYEYTGQRWSAIPELSFGRNTVSFPITQSVVFGLFAGLELPHTLYGSSSQVTHLSTTTTQFFVVYNSPLLIAVGCSVMLISFLLIWYIVHRRYRTK